MIIKLADLIIEVKARYRYTFDFCKDYIYDGEEKPVFTVCATDEDIEKERNTSLEFGDDVLENTCIYRNICREILAYGGMLIHSAVISVDNCGYMFSANSGTGKTTHMNLWLKKFGSRAFVVNGDKPIIRKIGNQFWVYGTPWCGKEGLNTNVGVPLKGITILERAENNSIVRVENKEALFFLLTQTPIPKQTKYLELMYNNFDELLKNVPVYRLGCNMEQEAADICYLKMSE